MSALLTKLSFADLAPAFLAQGFGAVGAVDFELALPLYQEHASRYQAWLNAKKHGAMDYLQRGLPRRLDPTLVFPELKSVIAVLLPYSPHPIQANGLQYARYLNGSDYHETIQQKLESAMQNLIAEQTVPKDFRYKICVDTSAVLERTWAMLCGLGWIGKNTLLIHPQLGSYVFLGVVFTNAEFNLGPELLKDYCGSCTRCLEVCPTKALSPHDLDARTCISYLTLEKRGEWETPLPTQGFLAGCDLCQEVCPYNTKAMKAIPPEKIAAHLEFDIETLLAETEVAYKARVKGTALSRVKYADFRRNLTAGLKQI
jgi:epoxyqueuosine reductase